MVDAELGAHPIVDFHTHLYAPAFGQLMLWGVDDLLTYHYVVAELFRACAVPPEQFFALPKPAQADLVWKHLFCERTPLSEACRGVVTSLNALGLETGPGELPKLRRFFAEQDPDHHVDRVMELAGVRAITMTNDVFDDAERVRWLDGGGRLTDSRFHAVLRIDPVVVARTETARRLREWGYGGGIEEERRFLREWIERMDARYVAVSLPPDFRFPSRETVLEDVVLPVCAERGLPFAMMIGARRGVNRALGQAGDGAGKADVDAVVNLCRMFPSQRFFVTMLSREDQHELCVAARKFRNLTPFGCWWFLNVPSLVEEITRMRVELLGTTFLPQHSDARVLEQLVYKWRHSRTILAKVLADKYVDIARAGWPVSAADVRRDVTHLFDARLVDGGAP